METSATAKPVAITTGEKIGFAEFYAVHSRRTDTVIVHRAVDDVEAADTLDCTSMGEFLID